MAYNLPNDHFVDVQVAWTDAKGNPAQVDGPTSWNTSDQNIAGVDADGTDSTKARVTPGANIGNAQVSASADADLGQGVTTITCLMDVTVVAGQAVAGTITPAGPPQPLP